VVKMTVAPEGCAAVGPGSISEGYPIVILAAMNDPK